MADASGQSPAPAYLQPYVRAAVAHDGGFGSLLWASPATQATRFDAIARLVNTTGRSIVDAGCGHADLFNYLLSRDRLPSQYIGVEAVNVLCDKARTPAHPAKRIVRSDFLKNPQSLEAGADYIIFCGSLNTISPVSCDITLRHAMRSARRGVIFNFLCSPMLAGTDYLVWRPASHLAQLAGQIASRYTTLSDYLDGDCTMLMEV